MNTSPVPQREVLVRFDSSRTQFILEPNGEVNIPALSGQVSFPLASVATVFYPSNPIQWVDDNLQPINPPDGVTIQRDKLNTSITVAVPAPARLSFYIIVQTTDGKFFGTDPTIVTMRPGDGG
jgi:hypothetical protein